VIVKILFHLGSLEAFSKIAFTSSFVVSFLEMKVISTIEPQTTGTRIEIPSKSHFSTGNASVTAIAAPVELGIMF
jgi:hypothetical protein